MLMNRVVMMRALIQTPDNQNTQEITMGSTHVPQPQPLSKSNPKSISPNIRPNFVESIKDMGSAVMDLGVNSLMGKVS